MARTRSSLGASHVACSNALIGWTAFSRRTSHACARKGIVMARQARNKKDHGGDEAVAAMTLRTTHRLPATGNG